MKLIFSLTLLTTLLCAGAPGDLRITRRNAADTGNETVTIAQTVLSATTALVQDKKYTGAISTRTVTLPLASSHRNRSIFFSGTAAAESIITWPGTTVRQIGGSGYSTSTTFAIGNVEFSLWSDGTDWYLADSSGSAGGGGAPTDVDYLVGTASGSLSAEIVVGTSPGGELGGTWSSPTLDDSLAVSSWNLTTPIVTTYADFGTAGVRVSDDGDGAITFSGLGNGSDENFTFNLDDTANTITLSSSTGVTLFDFGTIGFDADGGNNTLGALAWDASAANLKAGTFTLVAGSATVSNTSVTTNSVIVCTLKTVGGVRVGNPDIVPTASTGFTATGGGSDTSTYNYIVLEIAP
jgi:hypothetical protein